jgi:hypothetical protein
MRSTCQNVEGSPTHVHSRRRRQTRRRGCRLANAVSARGGSSVNPSNQQSLMYVEQTAACGISIRIEFMSESNSKKPTDDHGIFITDTSVFHLDIYANILQLTVCYGTKRNET